MRVQWWRFVTYYYVLDDGLPATVNKQVSQNHMCWYCATCKRGDCPHIEAVKAHEREEHGQ